MYKLLMMVWIFAWAGSVHGQKKEKNEKPSKLYFKIYTGKGILTPGSYRVTSSNGLQYTDPVTFITHDTARKSEPNQGLGNAFRIGGGIGIIKSDFLNIGLDVEWMMKDKSSNDLNIAVNSSNHINSTDRMSYSMLTMTPYLIFKALAKPKFYVYNKLGILFTLPFTLHTEGSADKKAVYQSGKGFNSLYGVNYPDSYLSIGTDDHSTYDNKYKISLGIGVNVSFGINYRINDQLRVFGEVFGNYTGLSPATSVTKNYSTGRTLFTIDSTNFHYELPQDYEYFLTTRTTYKKEGAVSYYGPEAVGRKYSINMSSIGINVGIVRRFR